ncbi:MAG: SDR family NAD(P)-dependent oxidoreductase, partial [Planctomycetes bacterium]|nr:SDR family NAD(P)-dependent oxidoreductase [Planctomycetota bacterium]
EGAAVALLARSRGELAEVARAVAAAGGRALPLAVDVTEEAAVDAAIEQVEREFGRLDVLVNNAGLFKVKPLVELDRATWEALLATNLSGPFFATRAVVRAMLRRPAVAGRVARAIVNVSSEAGKRGFAGSTAYCATKYGLCGFGDALREELRGHAIRVIQVLPGQVDTQAWDACGLDLARLGIRRESMLRPEQVADAIAHAVLAEGAVVEELLLKPP